MVPDFSHPLWWLVFAYSGFVGLLMLCFPVYLWFRDRRRRFQPPVPVGRPPRRIGS